MSSARLLPDTSEDDEDLNFDLSPEYKFDAEADEDEDDLLLPPVVGKGSRGERKKSDRFKWLRPVKKSDAFSQTAKEGETGCLETGMLGACFGVRI